MQRAVTRPAARDPPRRGLFLLPCNRLRLHQSVRRKVPQDVHELHRRQPARTVDKNRNDGGYREHDPRVLERTLTRAITQWYK